MRGESQIYGRGCLWCFLSTLLSSGVAERACVQSNTQKLTQPHTHRQVVGFAFLQAPQLHHVFSPLPPSFKNQDFTSLPQHTLDVLLKIVSTSQAEPGENCGIPFYSFDMTQHVDACFSFPPSASPNKASLCLLGNTCIRLSMLGGKGHTPVSN